MMGSLPQSDDFRSIVLDRTPLIDVRAPVEFEKGAFPGAVNLPLMNDRERHLVGIRYKESGNEAAVELGHQLVSGEIKASRIHAWEQFKTAHPDALLYCFRGGQRSDISQRWMHEAGTSITRLKGGYKAFRNYLMQETENAVHHFKPLIIGGRTGSGKTLLLAHIANAIDLEGLANHRGSSFGRQLTPQPTQINFENALAYELIRKTAQGFDTLVFEDEGKNVGSLYFPNTFTAHLSQAPLIILEAATDERVDITFDEYVVSALEQYEKVYSENPLAYWTEDMQKAMARIERRIGNQRYVALRSMFDQACELQRSSGDMQAHRVWIEYLLRDYYDPMYDYQISKRMEKVVFKGNAEEVRQFIRTYQC